MYNTGYHMKITCVKSAMHFDFFTDKATVSNYLEVPPVRYKTAIIRVFNPKTPQKWPKLEKSYRLPTSGIPPTQAFSLFRPSTP